MGAPLSPYDDNLFFGHTAPLVVETSEYTREAQKHKKQVTTASSLYENLLFGPMTPLVMEASEYAANTQAHQRVGEPLRLSSYENLFFAAFARFFV